MPFRPEPLPCAVDKISSDKREELFLALLTYAGPPPKENGYTEWCKVVEVGTKTMYPYWGIVDVLDATIQFRHWCCNRGTKARRQEKVDNVLTEIQHFIRTWIL